MSEQDSTQPSFPTYASLTQTAAWAHETQPMIEGQIPAPPSDTGPRYKEGALLGSGGMGKVMLALDERIGREVAVKELHTNRTLSLDERARFLREARVQGQLEHPAIVPVYDIDRRPDGTMFFTMRRVMGKTLHVILEELRVGVASSLARYTQRELLSAFATVCLAVDYAHSRGVIHRDLKPANLMLGDFGEVYVLDWGLARLLGESRAPIEGEPAPRLSTPGELLGTPLYMAPEQMADPDVGVAADVYSLGAILFELLTLVPLRDPRAPFVPPDARPSQRTPERRIAPELEAICVRATELETKDRYPSARAIQQAVIRYLEGDRDAERRRELATEHAHKARAALGKPDDEAARGAAIRELGRALAFDPHNREHIAMFTEILASPPSMPPPVVQEQLHKLDQAVMRSGERHATIAAASWFLFLPVVMWIGVRDWTDVAWIGIPAGVSALLALVSSGRKQPSVALHMLAVVAMMIASMALTRLYGPLILMPTMIATYVIVLQAHPLRGLRALGIVLAIIAMTLPLVLEITSVIDPAYVFENGRWLITPHMLDMPYVKTLAFLGLVNAGLIIVPCAFIAKLRGDLAAAQKRQAIQTWHFRRVGEELLSGS